MRLMRFAAVAGFVLVLDPAPVSAQPPITFAKDVALILFNRCGACHRPGGSGPFSLLTYSDAKQRGTQIVEATRRRLMPPWKAEPPESVTGEFVGMQPLADSEIAALQRWVEEGAVEGDARDLPPLPRWTEGWQLGAPDLTVTPEPYTLRTGGADVFRSWTPGQVPPLLPKGLAWRLDRGTDLVVELHLQPGGKPEVVQPSIGFFFATDPPERTPVMLRLGRQSLDIPAGARAYTIADAYVLPVDVEVQAVQPHAHFRAREVSGIATLPDGTTKRLVHITDWDFRWQHVYRFITPVRLPKGTTLTMRYTYDNSADNPRNTGRPARVVWGQRSTDEMGDLWIQVLTRDDRDRETLNRDFRPKMIAEDIVGYQARIDAEPADASLHDDVALLYLESGRPREAVSHFGASLALKPASASAHYNLGTALGAAGRLDEAIAEYRLALGIRPDYVLAHTTLGGALLQRGDVDESLAHSREAIRLDPANAGAHHHIGLAHRMRGEWSQAVDRLRRAVQLEPDSAGALADLAWLLAAAPDEALRDADRAVQLAERAVMLTLRRDPLFLDALAAAYAAAGHFDRSIETIEAALRLAADGPLAAGLGEREALYHQRKPYRLR